MKGVRPGIICKGSLLVGSRSGAHPGVVSKDKQRLLLMYSVH